MNAVPNSNRWTNGPIYIPAYLIRVVTNNHIKPPTFKFSQHSTQTSLLCATLNCEVYVQRRS